MSGYCNYCGKLIEDKDMIRTFTEDRRLVWVGCYDCYLGRLENDKKQS